MQKNDSTLHMHLQETLSKGVLVF
nr:unnamed protein product [Callosobruchus analis]